MILMLFSLVCSCAFFAASVVHLLLMQASLNDEISCAAGCISCAFSGFHI